MKPLTRLDHIAFRTENVTPVVSFYTQKLGFQIVQELEMVIGSTQTYSNVLQLPGQPFYIFVDMGLDADNIIARWVKKHGSGLHHMAYLVEDIQTAADLLRKSGMTFTTEHVVDTGGGLKQLFSYPGPGTGVITEIIERYRDDVFFVRENVIRLIGSTEGL